MIDRMNMAVILLLVCIVSVIFGAYVLRDELNPLTLHNTPIYPPPEYGKYGWAVNDFAITSNTCMGTLAAGSNCVVTVTFMPTSGVPK